METFSLRGYNDIYRFTVWKKVYEIYNLWDSDKKRAHHVDSGFWCVVSDSVQNQVRLLVENEDYKKKIASLERSIQSRDNEIEQLKADNEKIDKMYDELKIKEEMKDSYIKVEDIGSFIRINSMYRKGFWSRTFKKDEIEGVYIDTLEKKLIILKVNKDRVFIRGFDKSLKKAFGKIEKILNKK